MSLQTGLATELIGRDAELVQVRRVLERADGTSRGSIIVIGAGGTGRSALVNAALDDVGLAPVRLPGVPTQTGVDYTSLRHALQVAIARDASVLATSLFQVLGGAGSAAPAAVARALLSRLHRVEDRRGVLVIDDVQYHDRASQQVISYLAHHGAAVGLRTLITGNETTDLAVFAGLETLWLRSLSESDLRLLLERGLDVGLPFRIAKTLHTWSGGNATLALDLARQLSEPELTGSHPIGLPLTPSPALVEALGRRVRGLGTVERRLLAVFARCETLGIEVIESLADDCQTIDDLVTRGWLRVHQRRVRPGRRLDALVAWTLLTPSAQQELDLALSELLRPTRAVLADYLAASGGDHAAADRLVERPGQLYDAGISDVAAAAMALALAQQISVVSATNGHRSAGSSIPGRAYALAQLLIADGYTAAAGQQLGPLYRDGACPRSALLSLLAEMATVSGDPTEAVTRLDVDTPPTEDVDTWLRGVLTVCRIQVALDGPAQPARVMRAIQPALDKSSAETSALADLVAAESEVYGEAPGSPSVLHRAVQAWARQRTTPSATRHRSGAVDVGLATGVVDLLGLGHINAARELLSSTSVQQLPFATARAGVLTLRTEAEIAAGHYRLAATSLFENDRERPGPSVGDLMVTSQAIRIGAACGDLPECRTIENRLSRSTGIVLTYPARRAHTAALGFRELVSGHYERSRDLLALALQGPALQLQGRSCVLADLVEATAATGDRVAAAEALERHSGWLPDREGERSPGLLARCRAMVAPVEEVDDRFSEALAAHPPTHETDRARTWLAYGRTLLGLGRSQEARPAFNAAQELFRELRLGGWEEHLQQLSEPALSPDHPGDPGEVALTDVEQQILALVMQRKRNREIAATLFVSLRTVESHLTRIFRKLGVSTKSQLYRHHHTDEHSAAGPA